MTTRAQVDGVMLLAADMVAAGQSDFAERLLRLFTGATAEPAVGADPTQGRTAKSNKERQADLRARRAALRVTENVTESNGSNVTRNGDTLRVARVSDSENSPLSGVVSAESDTSEKSGRESARNGVTEKVTGVTRNVTVSVTPAVMDASASTHHALWRQIFEQWVFIAHAGKSIGSPSQFSQSFTDIARMAEQRCPHEPVQYATEVMRRYVLDRRQKGKAPNPRYFAADFGTFADSTPAQPGAPVLDPVVREMRELNAKYAEAQQRGDAVAEATYEQKLKLLGQRILANAS
jgi:hypothetical protein